MIKMFTQNLSLFKKVDKKIISVELATKTNILLDIFIAS